MNFDKHAGTAKSAYGYPVALGFMALVAIGLVAVFRRRGWL